MTSKKKKDNINKPAPLFFPTFRIEADGRGKHMRVLVSGIVGISELSDESIRLLTRRESLKISGRRLYVSIFEGNTVEIAGEIECIGRGARNRAESKKND